MKPEQTLSVSSSSDCKRSLRDRCLGERRATGEARECGHSRDRWHDRGHRRHRDDYRWLHRCQGLTQTSDSKEIQRVFYTY
jgi:hypothetical protein